MENLSEKEIRKIVREEMAVLQNENDKKQCNSMIPETITYAEAVKRYTCDRKAIKRAVDSKKIDAYKPGKSYLLDLTQADAWFMSTKVHRRSRDPRK
ncbi:hypothetical protein [Desulfopila sp. IMCC35008]|uniref:hypothetical protein n=1 Tax=Desulfopila sp. IMCC35008 TaxID=2653858 RepID=UPI0013D23B48|nr:hypothetical protein [Desulfopila sp. IMCC35008]